MSGRYNIDARATNVMLTKDNTIYSGRTRVCQLDPRICTDRHDDAGPLQMHDGNRIEVLMTGAWTIHLSNHAWAWHANQMQARSFQAKSTRGVHVGLYVGMIDWEAGRLQRACLGAPSKLQLARTAIARALTIGRSIIREY